MLTATYVAKTTATTGLGRKQAQKSVGCLGTYREEAKVRGVKLPSAVA